MVTRKSKLAHHRLIKKKERADYVIGQCQFIDSDYDKKPNNYRLTKSMDKFIFNYQQRAEKLKKMRRLRYRNKKQQELYFDIIQNPSLI